MERQPPSSISDEIDLYIRTFYSLLRSSGEVFVRAFEEAHLYSRSSLHEGARGETPDVAAFAYCAARLPECMPQVSRVVLGQSHEHFEAAGLDVRSWSPVLARGRRRPLRWDGSSTLAAFITSTSDIDDLIPILTAYQIEWNKLHPRLRALVQQADREPQLGEIAECLGVEAAEEEGGTTLETLHAALGADWLTDLREIGARPQDLAVRLLSGSLSQYQRAAQRWWSGIEPHYVRPDHPRRPAFYFVSSNMHALSNLLGGYATAHRERILAFARRNNPEGLAAPLMAAVERGDEPTIANLTYYLLRAFLHSVEAGSKGGILEDVLAYDAEGGITTIESPGRVDVSAQIIELGKIREERLDPRLRMPGLAALAASDAVILNIDYPLGMAAYHHLSRLGQGTGEPRGLYVMGKAATLNGRVGDVMISSVVHDEHSRNTYLFRNAFLARDVQPHLTKGTVFDNQKALTVRGPFLQNREYMGVFYREGYSVLEMEAGPYLAAVYELVHPTRHPNDEIVHLSNQTPFDIGLLHYASDTPYSRRQSLLSKSLSYFGVESTYGCALAIARRILEAEIGRLGFRPAPAA